MGLIHTMSCMYIPSECRDLVLCHMYKYHDRCLTTSESNVDPCCVCRYWSVIMVPGLNRLEVVPFRMAAYNKKLGPIDFYNPTQHEDILDYVISLLVAIYVSCIYSSRGGWEDGCCILDWRRVLLHERDMEGGKERANTGQIIASTTFPFPRAIYVHVHSEWMG